MNAQFVNRDLNDFGPVFYSNQTFYYGEPLNGDCIQLPPAAVQVVHPVLSGREYAAKMLALRQRSSAAPDPWTKQKLRWTAHKLNVISRW